MILSVKRRIIALSQWIIGISLIGLLLLIAMITLIDPNQFKPLLSTYLQEKTGKNVRFNGPLLWQLDPLPSIVAYDVSSEIFNGDLKSTLVLQTIRLQPKFLSLFSMDSTHWFANGILSIKLENHPILEGAFKTEINIQDKLSKVQVILTNGKVQGIDLNPLLQHAHKTGLAIHKTFKKRETLNLEALLNAEFNEWKKQATQTKPLQTPFQTLSTTLTVENGQVKTANIQLFHPHYTVSGQGTLDLNTHLADYQLSALLKSHHSPKAPALVIRLQGTVENLAVSPDLNQYANMFLPSTPSPSPVVLPISQPTVPQHELEQLFGLP